jgi:biopolymer transport protein ExbB
LGTVWGILNALTRISLSGQPNLAEIAGPIGEALVMTAIGLFVAVPAVMGYNWLLRRNRAISEEMRLFAADVHSYLVGGARFDTSTPVSRTAAPRATPVARTA